MRFRFFEKTGMRTALLFVGLGAAVIAAAFLFLSQSASAGHIARSALSACASSETKSECYEKFVPPLYPKSDVATLFEAVRLIRERDPEYQFCHVLAHEIGERVVARQSDAWLDAIALNPRDGLCSNGFIHGAVAGKFRSEVLDSATIESLIPDFSRACEPRASWRPSDLDKAICYHGLGHLYTFITDADLRKGIDICAQTSSERFRRVCVEGVFMQVFQPLEPDDFELLKRLPRVPTKETVRDFCAPYGADEYVGACLRESWPLFAESVRSGEGVAAFCVGQPNANETRRCYESASAIIGRVSLDSSGRAVSACGKLPVEWRETCFVAVARAVLEEDRDAGEKALALCRLAPGDFARSCEVQLAREADFLFGKDAARKNRFCALLPVELQYLCL